MNDSNHLQNALGKLPNYSPDESSWLEIKQALNDVPLKSALNALPTYEAPEFEMPKKEAIIEQEISPNFKLPRLPKISFKAAAAVTFFLVGYYFVASHFLEQTPAIETESAVLMPTPSSETNVAFEELMQVCEADVWVCKNNEFTTLKNDFNELDNAQKELVNAMELYGGDVNLMRQFNEIERKKALILNDLSLFM